jgi:hypothetical protein
MVKSPRLWAGGIGLLLAACSGTEILAGDGGGGSGEAGSGCSFFCNGAGGFAVCEYTSQTPCMGSSTPGPCPFAENFSGCCVNTTEQGSVTAVCDYAGDAGEVSILKKVCTGTWQTTVP